MTTVTVKMDTQLFIWCINGALALAAFFGGMVLKDLSGAVKELRDADERMSERLSNYVLKDEFREFRQEQKENFERIFDKLEDLRMQVSAKADRRELRG